MNKFEEIKRIYIDNLVRSEYPIIPAYFYYLEHTSSRNILNQEEFEYLFMKSVNEKFNMISCRVEPALMNIEEIFNILNNYYNIAYLCNPSGELVKIV